MRLFSRLDWRDVRRHYSMRMKIHKHLVKLLREKVVWDFVNLALGITDAFGNCSANQHGLGPKILATNRNAANQVFGLAAKFLALKDGGCVPELIRNANMSNLQIGVGSEISCMVNPRVCWAANRRTIWIHLAMKHKDAAKADEELTLYRERDSASEMDYSIWSVIHGELGASLRQVAESGRRRAVAREVNPGSLTYLWADAIASCLYDAHHPRERLHQ
jgi:hypothetical protein